MSYPPARYHGKLGEITARYRPASTARDLTRGAVSAGYLATGTSTGGHFGLYEWHMGPRAGGPSAHFHRSISESFYVLSGTVRLYNGQQWIDGGPGDFLFVPEGGAHGFSNESDEAASMLLLFTPGAPREGYFEGLAELGQLSDAEREDFFLRHDTYWL